SQRSIINCLRCRNNWGNPSPALTGRNPERLPFAVPELGRQDLQTDCSTSLLQSNFVNAPAQRRITPTMKSYRRSTS
ncbi:MAG TPA: hypothetical protein VMW38_29425, partial [Terriglobia bacterium]|nr:hypothetical protein [Terriglobia bacterium]